MPYFIWKPRPVDYKSPVLLFEHINKKTPRLRGFWSWRRDLNPRPADYKSAALPAELRQQKCIEIYPVREKIRITCIINKVILSQGKYNISINNVQCNRISTGIAVK